MYLVHSTQKNLMIISSSLYKSMYIYTIISSSSSKSSSLKFSYHHNIFSKLGLKKAEDRQHLTSELSTTHFVIACCTKKPSVSTVSTVVGRHAFRASPRIFKRPWTNSWMWRDPLPGSRFCKLEIGTSQSDKPFDWLSFVHVFSYLHHYTILKYSIITWNHVILIYFEHIYCCLFTQLFCLTASHVLFDTWRYFFNLVHGHNSRNYISAERVGEDASANGDLGSTNKGAGYPQGAHISQSPTQGLLRSPSIASFTMFPYV